MSANDPLSLSDEEVKPVLQTGIMPVIEKGIPIPMQIRGNASKWRDTLQKMDDEDSFLINTNKERLSVRAVARRLAIKITTRKVEGGDIRVWRDDKK